MNLRLPGFVAVLWRRVFLGSRRIYGRSDSNWLFREQRDQGGQENENPAIA